MTEDKVPFPVAARNFKHKTQAEKRIRLLDYVEYSLPSILSSEFLPDMFP